MLAAGEKFKIQSQSVGFVCCGKRHQRKNPRAGAAKENRALIKTFAKNPLAVVWRRKRVFHRQSSTGYSLAMYCLLTKKGVVVKG